MATVEAILDFQSERFYFIFYLQVAFLPSFESIGLSVQEQKGKIDFQDGGHCGHLGFSIGTILAMFNL